MIMMAPYWGTRRALVFCAAVFAVAMLPVGRPLFAVDPTSSTTVGPGITPLDRAGDGSTVALMPSAPSYYAPTTITAPFGGASAAVNTTAVPPRFSAAQNL